MSENLKDILGSWFAPILLGKEIASRDDIILGADDKKLHVIST